MITEQQLREIERDWQHHPDITDVSDLIAELRLVKQQLHEAEERAAGDDVTFKRLLDERTEADRQRDATLGTYAEAKKRWKTIIAARDREQALYVQANHDFRDALTEARLVLRECRSVLVHADSDCSASGHGRAVTKAELLATSEMLREMTGRVDAVLAQDADA